MRENNNVTDYFQFLQCFIIIQDQGIDGRMGSELS
jgi:hypothetical protein